MHNLIEHAKPLTIYLITWNNNNEKQTLYIYTVVSCCIEKSGMHSDSETEAALCI